MATVIKRRKSIERIFKEIEDAIKRSSKGVNTRKYCGVIKLRKNPIEIQKRMRDEWE